MPENEATPEVAVAPPVGETPEAIPDKTAFPAQVAPAVADHVAPVASSPQPVARTAVEMEGLAARLDTLSATLEESNRIALERERVIDRLYDENQRLKAGELQQALAPFLRDLMRLYDDLEKTVQSYTAPLECAAPAVLRDWECYRDTALDILFRQGIEPFAAAAGAPFNAKEHRACGSVPAVVQEHDRTIARVIRTGFKFESRLLRAADVEVYRFTVPLASGTAAS